MKRVLIALTFFATSAVAQTVSVGSNSATCGSSTSVPVTIDSVSGMLSLEFRVGYDTSRLTPTSVTAGSLTSNFSVSFNVVGGEVRVAMASGSPVSGGGSVALVNFSVGATANGNAALTLSNVLVNDVPRTGTAGSVNITCVQPPSAPILSSPSNGATGITAPVTLQWTAATGATSYRVFFGTTSSPPFFVSTNASSYGVSTQGGTTYYWSVESANDAGSAMSAVSTFTVAGALCITPTSPSLTAPSEATSGTAFTLSWTSPAATTQYVVEEAGSVSFAGATPTTVTANSLTITRTVAVETTLYFRVHGRNTAAGCPSEGVLSNVAAVRITPRAALPAGTRILPVVGTIEGTLGSLFRTAVQLHNPASIPATGRIIFHGQSGDATLAYSLAANETISYADLLAAMSTPRALGSADLVPDGGSSVPRSVVRIFNDAGAAGTSGMTVDQLELRDSIQAGQRGILLAPTDPNRMRMNIGIRTLLDGVTMTVTVRDKKGAMILSSRWSYPPTNFIQVPILQFANAVLLGDETVTFDVESGSAIVYGTTTDNVTQDPSIQYARPVN